MTAALRGRRKADAAQQKIGLLRAYNTGAFAGAAFGGNLKPFDHYFKDRDDAGLQHAHAIAFFNRLKARGIPIEITKTVN